MDKGSGEPGGQIPFAELGQFRVHKGSVQLLPYNYCLRNMVVVLDEVDPAGEDPVTIGMLEPADEMILHDLRSHLARDLNPVRLNAWEIQKALDKGYGHRETEEETGLTLDLKPVSDVSFDPDNPAMEMLNQVLARAVYLGASDVHIESYREDVDVRLRIDGLLYQMSTPLSAENIREVISRLKILAGMDIAEHRRAQDGRIDALYGRGGRKRRIDLRLSVLPGPHGEDAVLRILESYKTLIGLENLGFASDDLAVFERVLDNPEGLVLVTGPTGSGKTTTLYSAIDRVNNETNKVLTVEDPVEYNFPKVNQKQVTPAMGFADFARSFMRQDPDILLIGEIRDEETADIAMRAAQTGHLVLSTLHTTDAVRTITRLETLGLDANRISGYLLCSISQRLVRKLCEECREPAEPTPRERSALGLEDDDTTWYTARGCDACADLGYKGRLGIFELFVMEEALAQMIYEERPIQSIRHAARERGMRTLLEDALDKARKAETSLNEILRVVPYRIIAADRKGPVRSRT